MGAPPNNQVDQREQRRRERRRIERASVDRTGIIKYGFITHYAFYSIIILVLWSMGDVIKEIEIEYMKFENIDLPKE